MSNKLASDRQPDSKNEAVAYVPEELYCNFMDEIKLRIDCVEKALLRKYKGMPSQVVREFCYLQLRFVCELIAMACLVVHEDKMTVKKFEKLWSASDIVERLAKLNPNFSLKPYR